jgi:hypothetical protein
MSEPWWDDMSFRGTLHATADIVRQLAKIAGHNLSTENIRDSWVGDNDIYVRAATWCSDDALRSVRTPARNDGIDVLHFLYLEPGTILLSDDVRMLEIAEAVDVNTYAAGAVLG